MLCTSFSFGGGETLFVFILGEIVFVGITGVRSASPSFPNNATDSFNKSNPSV